ncbi:MAG: hypothetical protein H5U03_00170 [Clostridia bacterium]|nr:hypothetical protein [Clostridia bacterium]
MKLSEILPLEEWVIVRNIAGEYAQDPKLVVAIGWHETHWGRLGAGREGWILGYGYFPGSKVKEKYRGLENQLRGACWQMQRDLKKPLTYANLLDFAVNSWRPGNPQAWAQSVWSIYQSLVDDLTQELTPEPWEPGPPPPSVNQYVTDTSIRGLFGRIAAKIREIGDILDSWRVE